MGSRFRLSRAAKCGKLNPQKRINGVRFADSSGVHSGLKASASMKMRNCIPPPGRKGKSSGFSSLLLSAQNNFLGQKHLYSGDIY